MPGICDKGDGAADNADPQFKSKKNYIYPDGKPAFGKCDLLFVHSNTEIIACLEDFFKNIKIVIVGSEDDPSACNYRCRENIAVDLQ